MAKPRKDVLNMLLAVNGERCPACLRYAMDIMEPVFEGHPAWRMRCDKCGLEVEVTERFTGPDFSGVMRVKVTKGGNGTRPASMARPPGAGLWQR